MQVFKTKKEAISNVEIVGVGSLPAEGKGGIDIEQAAQAMSELQEQDEYGRLVTDDNGQPKPLSGSALTSAAKQWAEERGLEVITLTEDKYQKAQEDAIGLPPLPPARETSIAHGKAMGHVLEDPVNTDGEALAQGDLVQEDKED